MEESIRKLIAGFHSFRDAWFAGDSELFDQLRRGQRPKACIIACSDSRVDPALLMQCDPGDLFVIRNVANLVPPCEHGGTYHGVSAALEYAVRELEVEHVILLGHSDCGGIRALMTQTSPAPRGGFLASWLSLAARAKEAVEFSMKDAPERTRCRACEEASLILGLENLLTFPWIKSRVDAGALSLHAWYFHMSDGRLYHYDRERQGFFRLNNPLPEDENE